MDKKSIKTEFPQIHLKKDNFNLSKISIVVPAYNEEKTICAILEKLLDIDFFGLQKEIIVINDCSKDNTLKVVEDFSKNFSSVFKVISNEKNLGKSQSVKKGILESTGDVVVVQDADLEYNPNDLKVMLEVMVDKKCDVVYGNRFGKKNKVIYWQNYFGNKFLSFISNLFTFPRIKKWIPDMEVCYKMVKGPIIRNLAKKITSRSNFGIEPEITAMLSKYKKNGELNLHFEIVPIDYFPRSIAEGKKMKAIRDGFKALKEIIIFNLFNSR